MPLTREAADAFGVVTICLAALLILLGLLCAVYSCYFRSRIRSQGFIHLSYFSGPWIIRISFVLFVIWWGFGEISRLSFLRRKGRILNALDIKWQQTACKCYIVSNLFLCTYPLFSTILLGLFVTVLTIYMIWLGRRILKLVINKGLQKRVYALMLFVSSFLPSRIVLLGFSVLSKPGQFLFEALTFTAFLALLSSAGLCLCMVVYFPIADSLSLGRNPQQGLEARRRTVDDQDDTISLMGHRRLHDLSAGVSPSRNSNASISLHGWSGRPRGHLVGC